MKKNEKKLLLFGSVFVTIIMVVTGQLTTKNDTKEMEKRGWEVFRNHEIEYMNGKPQYRINIESYIYNDCIKIIKKYTKKDPHEVWMKIKKELVKIYTENSIEEAIMKAEEFIKRERDLPLIFLVYF